MEFKYIFSLEGKNYLVDLLSPLKIKNLVIEITSKCNLRCTICAKSEKDNDKIPGRDMDMPPIVIEKTVSFVEDEKIQSISLVGYGEPTLRSDWITVCEQLTQITNARLNLVTNFGRKCEPKELEYLLRFNFIGISIESTNAAVMKQIRRSVDLSTIITNIVEFRALARVIGINRPYMLVNCTVTQRNVFGLKKLAALCIELGIDQLNISSLFESETASMFGDQSIEYFTPDQLISVKNEIAQAQQLLIGTSTKMVIQPRLSQLVNGQKEVNWQVEGLTRICLQPWGSYTVGADGQIYPCCVVREPFIHIDEGRDRIVNGERIRQFRKQLLDGVLPTICQKCSNAPLGTKDALARTLAVSAFNEGLAVIWQAETSP